MSDESFNGWPNRETWCTALYLGNDHGTYLETQAATARGLVRAADFANEYPEVTLHVYRHVAIEIEAMVQGWRDELTDGGDGYENASVPAGLLSMFLEIGSLWRVDFDEIAKAKLDQFPVELLQPKQCAKESWLHCSDCGVAVHWIPDEWHFCDWQPVAVDVLGLEFDHAD